MEDLKDLTQSNLDYLLQCLRESVDVSDSHRREGNHRKRGGLISPKRSANLLARYFDLSFEEDMSSFEISEEKSNEGKSTSKKKATESEKEKNSKSSSSPSSVRRIGRSASSHSGSRRKRSSIDDGESRAKSNGGGKKLKRRVASVNLNDDSASDDIVRRHRGGGTKVKRKRSKDSSRSGSKGKGSGSNPHTGNKRHIIDNVPFRDAVLNAMSPDPMQLGINEREAAEALEIMEIVDHLGLGDPSDSESGGEYG